jgi:hypothetical protein
VRTTVVSLDADYDIGPLVEASGTLPYLVHVDDAPLRLQQAIAQVSDPCLGPIEPDRCPTLEVPNPGPASTPDPDKIWVLAGPPGDPEYVPRLSAPAECEGSAYGGFFVEGSLIHFCPCSCPRMFWGNAVVMQACLPPAKNGTPCTDNAQCASNVCFGRAPVSGALPPKTCNNCLEASHYDQWCDEDADCCSGLHCGVGERAGVCVL